MSRVLSLELAWAHIRAGFRRVSLSILAIALGVALVVAVGLMNDAVLASFIDAVNALGGRAALTVMVSEGVTIPSELQSEIESTEGVKLAVPLIRSTTFVDAEDRRREPLTVFGIDVAREEAVRIYHDETNDVIADPIEFLNSPDSIVMGRVYAERLGLTVGNVVPLVTPRGVERFTIRGLIDPVGVARALEGRLVVMDIDAAQKHFTARDRVSQIDVVLADDASIDRVREALAAKLPAGMMLMEPQHRQQMVERMIGGFQAVLSAFSILVVVAGLLICFGRFGAIFEARTWEVGLLRAVGMRQSAVTLELLKESLIVGLAGTLAGIPLGFVIAQAALPRVARMFAITFRGPSAATLGGDRTLPVVIGVGVGVLAALLAALVPVVRLVRKKPIAALTLRGRDEWTTRQGRGGLTALVLLALSAVLIAVQRTFHLNTLGFVTTLLIALAATFGAGGIVRLSGQWLTRLASRLGHPTAEFAAGAFLRQPRRISTTVATVGIGLGAILMFGMLASSAERTLHDNLTFHFQSHLAIASPFASSGYRTAPLDDAIVDKVRRVPGVSGVCGSQSTDLAYGDDRGGIPPVLWSHDPDAFRKTALFKWPIQSGALPDALEQVAAGSAVLVSSTFAQRFAVAPGQSITLHTSKGPLSILVVGVTTASPEPAVFMSRDTYEQWWGDESVYLVFVAMQGDGDHVATKQAIMQAVAGYRVELRSIPTLVESLASQVGDVFSALYLLQGITFVLIMIAVGDTLATEVLERVREFAVLRAVGLRRSHVFELVVMEGVGIGAVGLTLALATGAALGFLWVRVQFPAIVEWQIDPYVPWGFVGAACLVMLSVAVVGSLGPALRAARVTVRDSLRDE